MAWWDRDFAFNQEPPKEEKPPGQEMSLSEQCEDLILVMDASSVQARCDILDCFSFTVDVKEGENLAEVEKLFAPWAEAYCFEKYYEESSETHSEWLYIPNDGTALMPGLDGTFQLEEILGEAGFVHTVSGNGKTWNYFRPDPKESKSKVEMTPQLQEILEKAGFVPTVAENGGTWSSFPPDTKESKD